MQNTKRGGGGREDELPLGGEMKKRKEGRENRDKKNRKNSVTSSG